MPLYEFKCKKCGKKFEDIVKSSAKDGTVKCLHCGSKETEKQLSACAGGSKSEGLTSGHGGCAPTRGGG